MLIRIATGSAKLLRGRGFAVAVGAALFFGVAAPASGQIYTWRDANGNLVLSNRPQPGSSAVRSYAVPKADDVRATRYVTAERGHAFDDIISVHSRLNGVRADLVRAVMQVESAFNPYARSPKGALGLMQLMPVTIRQYGVRNPFDPGDNVRAGVKYLRELLDRYENDEELALAAYNAGPTAVDKHGQSAHMALHKHPIHGPHKRLTAIPASPQTLANRTHVESMRLCHALAPGTACGAWPWRSGPVGLSKLVPRFSLYRRSTNVSSTPVKVIPSSVISTG